MLPKNKRIPRKLFKPLVESGNYSSSKNFSLKTTPASNWRVAVAVSKKVSKSAVVRNRVRRRVYATIDKMPPNFPKKLFFLIAKPGAKNTEGEELKKELSELFKTG